MEQKAGGYYRPIFSLPVIVAALGYFVDIYDEETFPKDLNYYEEFL